jgi:thiosulfate reductase cytochrome b subunit
MLMKRSIWKKGLRRCFVLIATPDLFVSRVRAAPLKSRPQSAGQICMSIDAAHDIPSTRGKKLHPWPLRVMHWLNAIVMAIMITSGWGIYDDNVIFSWLVFPDYLKLGHWAQDSLLWHFAAMWFLGVNGVFYLTYGLLTGRFRRQLFPIRFADLIETVRETLRLHLAHDDLTKYNAVQKLLYLTVIFAGVLQVITGVAIWKPVQFAWLTALFGGFQGARLAHFLGMAVIVGFVAIHVALAVLAPKTLWAMVSGGPRVTRS